MTTISPSAERTALDAVPTQLFIGGEWREASGGGTLPVEDPSTGETLAEVPDATVEDGKAALAAADEAFNDFRHVPPRDRGEILRRAYELMIERVDELALVMTLEMGKPLPEARGEVLYAASYFRWYAEEAVRINGRFQVAENGASRVLTMEQPVGPCLFITPWNFPLAMGTRKVGPAIAAGCTSVVKPAKQTPLSMLSMARILEEAGLPGGVVNVITARSSGELMEPLIRDARARKLSFTGSTAVGKKLVEQASNQLLRMSMELGGNAPFLVFEDADLDLAVEGALLAKIRNGGEACTSANRFVVHESVAGEFSRRLAERMGALRVARGTEPGSQVGPLIDQAAIDKVKELVDDAVGKGAAVLTGGEPLGERGYFFRPTVLGDVPEGADLVREEIFGPVAPITTFSGEDQAIAMANDTEYGLVAYLFTENVSRAFRVMEALETGMIGFNQGLVSNAGAPFGGVKQSGYGREGGPEGLREYLETKYVALNLSGRPAAL
ncbi:MAG: NAD-dependent succinate-semialdehyde dehydrogenase [Solirubrobacteraceae bacterium]|nr:NAD-dependent succinate-semialdehyde dehydrogenase [Solirubrobacteraceae bacterium]